MSGSAQQVSGTFTKISKGRILSIRDYLVGSYLLGGSAAASVKNRANPALPLLEVGVITALTIVAAGSGGTDGTYNLIFTGGNPTTPAAGTFTVSGGVVTAKSLTSNGQGYQSTPTVSLANCPGLGGAQITATKAAPSYNAHSTIIKPSATAGYGFQTQIISDEDYTLLLVRKNATISAAPIIFGMATGGANIFGFNEFGGANYGSAGESTSRNAGPTRARPAAGTIYFEAIVHQPLAYTQFYYGAGGALSVAPNAASTANQRRSTGPTAIPVYSQWLLGTGGLTDTITTNTVEVYFAAIYNRALSQAEIAQCYADVTAYLSTLGVTVA